MESLNSDSSDGNSETIIELQDQVNQLQKENTLLMEKYEELENKFNNYNLVKKPPIVNPKPDDKNPNPENGEKCPAIRSNTWLKGRNDNQESLSSIAKSLNTPSKLEMIFL